MSGGTRIIPIDGADTDAAYADSDAVPDSAMAAQAPDSSPEDEAFLTLPDRSWIAPALAAAVVAAWTALFGIAAIVFLVRKTTAVEPMPAPPIAPALIIPISMIKGRTRAEAARAPIPSSPR